MKTLFCNLKPYLSYCGVFALYYILGTFDVISSLSAQTVLIIVATIILNFITGYTDTVKKDKWGILVFTVQLVVCAFVKGESRVLVFGNLFLSVCFDYFYYGENAFFKIVCAVLSVLVPILPFFVGSYFKSRSKRKYD